MKDFNLVYLVYNPSSTGGSQTIAKEFKKDLGRLRTDCKIILRKTTHAGHGEELGYKLAQKGPNTLLISVSGDGGYHELINGVMKAVDEGVKAPICAVLPGGNANDHYTTISDRTLFEAVKANALTKIDLLKVETDKVRYAHSYAGLGLTPLVAVELNKYKLSAFKETWLALKTFWKFKPFKIIEDGKKSTYDSLIVANIGVMAKHLTLDSGSSLQDGKFEVLKWPHNHRLKLIKILATAAFGKSQKPESVKGLSFKTVNKIPMQLDGELMSLGPDQTVKITCLKQTLRTYR